MERGDTAGAGGFCTLTVVPPPHPASSEIAPEMRNRLHFLVATTSLLLNLWLKYSRTEIPLRLLPETPQRDNLGQCVVVGNRN